MKESSAEPRIIYTGEDCYEMLYWSIKFGISIERLIEAISKVGPVVVNVERHVRACTELMAAAANPDRYADGLADANFVQPDPTVFLVRNDKA